MDSHADAAGPSAAYIRELGLRCGVGAPIVVDGHVWGAAIIGSSRPEPLSPDSEARVGDFADLVATAIANAETRTQLAASRARIVAAGDEARRRLERNLHDGAQQRLVSLALQVRTVEASVPLERPDLKEQMSDIVKDLTGVSEELQELSRGIHPAILSRGGLGPALKTLARRSAVPVELHLAVDRRLPESAEVAAYSVVAEALTNSAKHAQASQVDVTVDVQAAALHLLIRDDGVGGADTGRGSGLDLRSRADPDLAGGVRWSDRYVGAPLRWSELCPRAEGSRPVSAKHHAFDDLPHLYPALTRSQIERVVTLLDERPSTDSGGMSVAAAIKPIAPVIAERVQSLSGGAVDEYLRIVKGAAVYVLASWKAAGAPPDPDDVYQAVRNIER